LVVLDRPWLAHLFLLDGDTILPVNIMPSGERNVPNARAASSMFDAAMYLLIDTCKPSDVEPEAYLRHVLRGTADHRISRIDQLLPWNVAAQLPTNRYL
jgi:hypothetical protein